MKTDKPTVLDPALITAYIETRYEVGAGPTFALTIDVASQPLKDLYTEKGVSCAAFITACNPCSKEVTEHENQQLQTELKNELDRRGLTYFQGAGKHPSNNWPWEESFLVIGLELEAAKSLAKIFKQKAIVWCNAAAIPKRILLF